MLKRSTIGRKTVLAAGLGALALVFAVVMALGGEWTEPEDGTGTRLDAGDAELVADGRRIYREACASCHGAELEGQADWQRRGPNGRLPAPPHDESGHTWHHPDAQLFLLTKLGPAALMNDPAYPSDMPGFGDVLSDRDIVAVLSYIKSTWPAEIRSRHDEINARAAGN